MLTLVLQKREQPVEEAAVGTAKKARKGKGNELESLIGSSDAVPDPVVPLPGFSY